ncbi:MAG: hypothetical protein J0M19_10025 [Sphingomonadales bacterium]|nr:hypothetical protein [Sphingomonadales bacterium]
MTGGEPPIIKGRSCGSCTLCCKVLKVPETDSGKGEWCRHCAVGQGCTIYAERPERCREFLCGYLLWDAVPDHWHPAKSRIVVVSELGFRINFTVDPGAPGRWREQPWYNDIKALAVLAFQENRQVLVTVGNKVTALVPAREVELGVVGEDEVVVTGRRPDGIWGAAKVHKNDPRMADGGTTVPLG